MAGREMEAKPISRSGSKRTAHEVLVAERMKRGGAERAIAAVARGRDTLEPQTEAMAVRLPKGDWR
jgi:hypothetical protein